MKTYGLCFLAMIGLHNCDIMLFVRWHLGQTKVLQDSGFGTNGIFNYDLV